MGSDPNILVTLRAVRALYPTSRPLSRQELGAILNATAWLYRDDGVGLELKLGGTTAEQPRTTLAIASDILRFPGDVGRDVLLDSDGVATPVWGEAKPANPNTFVSPVEPLPGTTPGPTKPGPGPAPIELLARVELLEALAHEQELLLKRQVTALQSVNEDLQRQAAALTMIQEIDRDLWARLLKLEAIAAALRSGVTTSRALGHAHRVQIG